MDEDIAILIAISVCVVCITIGACFCHYLDTKVEVKARAKLVQLVAISNPV